MKRASRFFIVVVLACLSCGSMLAQDGGERWLRIEVTSAEGRPVARACVTVIPREGEIVFRQSDRQGRVKVKGLTPGSYRIVVKADGYEAQKREVGVNAAAATVAFSLQPRKL